MKLGELALRRLQRSGVAELRHDVQSVNDWIMTFGGHQYPLGVQQTMHGEVEPPVRSFESYATSLFAANPVVWGAIQVRKAVFSQARFRWRNMQDGRLFGDASLRLLEQPWMGARTSTLLKHMLLHGDIGGNAYVLGLGNRLQLMRPDYVSVVLGSRLEPDNPYLAEDAELVGYLYAPMGQVDGARFYGPEQVAHFAPMPDPLAHFRGMSPLTPVVREIQGDKAMTEHKLKFFGNAATPNMVIKFDASQTVAQVKAFKELVEDEQRGLENAYKTLYLGGGADATLVGSNLQQMDFAATTGKAETRILMALGVHPVIAGASEGMQGAALNAGNFGQVRRIFSDIHLQDLWLEAASSLETLLPVPASSELTVDGRHIPFLQDDELDQANIDFTAMRSIAMAVREGYTPESAAAAVGAHDMSLLVHTGLLSVQLQPPFDPDADPTDADPTDDGEDEENTDDSTDGTA